METESSEVQGQPGLLEDPASKTNKKSQPTRKFDINNIQKQ